MIGGIGSGALNGYRVLDLSNLLAGPMLAMHLGDFGAEVIKVEKPGEGDEMRRWGHLKDGTGVFFAAVNRNKRLISVDIRTVAGQGLIRQLVTHMDVLVESFRPGTMERWGLGFDDLRQLNPDLVMTRVSGFGQTGPWATRPGFGTLAEAYSGFAFINGTASGPPMLPSFGLGDSSAAIFGAYGTALALLARDRCGGQIVDVSLYEGLTTLLGSFLVDYSTLGVVQERSDGRLPFAAPRNVYATAEGDWVAIAGSTQRAFDRLVAVIDPDRKFFADPRFATNASRVTNAVALDAAIAERVAVWRTEELMAALVAGQVPCAPAHSAVSLAADEHALERGSLVEVTDEVLGRVLMQAPAPRLSETPGTVASAARADVGADNADVLGSILGLSAEDIARLCSEGVL